MALLAAVTVTSPAMATLSIGLDADFAAGRAALGVATPQLARRNLFAAGTVWTAGAFAPAVEPSSQTDPTTGASVVGNLGIANYIDGIGFDMRLTLGGLTWQSTAPKTSR